MFYLQYHGYQAYFPLLALARWRNLNVSGELDCKICCLSIGDDNDPLTVFATAMTKAMG